MRMNDYTNQDILIELKEIIEAGQNAYATTKDEAVEIVEALEEMYVSAMYQQDGETFLIKSAIEITITVEDLEDGEIVVTKNTFTHDHDGTQLDYSSEELKSFKTIRGATNFAKKLGYEVKYI